MGILETVKKEKNKIIVDAAEQCDDNGIKRGVFEVALVQLKREHFEFFEQRGWDKRYFLDEAPEDFERCLNYIENEIMRSNNEKI